MKNFISKYKTVLALFIFIVIVVIPLLINFLFKLHTSVGFFEAEWEAGDFLGFYGSILGATATIMAIVITIDFTVNNQKEEHSLALKPFLSSSYSPIYGLPETNGTSNNILFVSIRDGVIGSSIEPPYSFSKAYEKSGDKLQDNKNSLRFMKKNFVIKYLLSNVGAGNAVSVNFKINGSIFIRPFAIPVNTTKTIVFILSDEILKDNEKLIKFSISYWDVATIAMYSQNETIRFYRDKNYDTLSTNQQLEWLLSSPLRIENVEVEKNSINNNR